MAEGGGRQHGLDEDGEQEGHMSKCKYLRTERVKAYQIIVADAADAVSVNFSGRCKFLQI